MTDSKMLAELLFPDIDKTPDYYENLYPKRNLPENAVVSRFAPSPTGFLHLGSLFAALIGRTAAKRTDGTFYLRIEDTDKKREVQDGISEIVNGLLDFGIDFDEGVISADEQKGIYAPYVQSRRKEIYQTYAKSLVEKGLAYPCFCTEEELAAVREEQTKAKKNPGYYGEYAKCRNLSYSEAEKAVKEGKTYVLRLKSPGKEENRICFDDAIRGKIEMPENIQDVVILKADGIPTYHFAHAVDDHLMGTTHVIRGDEWISSTPIHLQFFEVLGFEKPVYAHIAPIMKEENGGKRKLSKRKDPEAAVSFYHSEGYPKEAVIEYLLTLANSDYEEWRKNNPDSSNSEFDFSLSKMSQSGALFDLVKLTDISKNYISRLDTERVFADITEWARKYDEELYNLIMQDTEYAKSIFSIERGNEKPRKDIAKWSDVKDYIAYFYKELWNGEYDFPENLSKEDMTEILEEYKKIYSKDTTAESWFPEVREMSERLGYAKQPKLYKKNPELYRGHVGDVSTVIRVAATGRRNTPDLYSILQTLGYDEVMARFDRAAEFLRNI